MKVIPDQSEVFLTRTLVAGDLGIDLAEHQAVDLLTDPRVARELLLNDPYASIVRRQLRFALAERLGVNPAHPKFLALLRHSAPLYGYDLVQDHARKDTAKPVPPRTVEYTRGDWIGERDDLCFGEPSDFADIAPRILAILLGLGLVILLLSPWH